MLVSNLQDAINEAERFLAKARIVPIKDYVLTGRREGVTIREVKSGSEAAACKRASLDLTKALAKLRRES